MAGRGVIKKFDRAPEWQRDAFSMWCVDSCKREVMGIRYARRRYIPAVILGPKPRPAEVRLVGVNQCLVCGTLYDATFFYEDPFVPDGERRSEVSELAAKPSL